MKPIKITKQLVTTITLDLEDMIQALWENTYELSLESKGIFLLKYIDALFSREMDQIKEVFRNGATPSVVSIETMEELERLNDANYRFEFVITFKDKDLGTIHEADIQW